MTVHPRSDWTKVPAADAHPFDRGSVVGLACHWNGPAVPESALTDPRAYLEGVRRFHVNTRGWSDIAYNFAVDQTGDAWELRGMDHMSAANGDTEVNSKWVAVLAIIGDGQHPSPRLLDGLKQVAGMVRNHYPRATRVTTHQAIRPASTACPGPDLIPWVTATNFTEDDDVTENDKQEIAALSVAAFIDLLRDKDSKLSVALRGRVREAMQHEFIDEREGKNTARP